MREGPSSNNGSGSPRIGNLTKSAIRDYKKENKKNTNKKKREEIVNNHPRLIAISDCKKNRKN